jgi:hypothetical protein
VRQNDSDAGVRKWYQYPTGRCPHTFPPMSSADVFALTKHASHQSMRFSQWLPEFLVPTLRAILYFDIEAGQLQVSLSHNSRFLPPVKLFLWIACTLTKGFLGDSNLLFTAYSRAIAIESHHSIDFMAFTDAEMRTDYISPSS